MQAHPTRTPPGVWREATGCGAKRQGGLAHRLLRARGMKRSIVLISLCLAAVAAADKAAPKRRHLPDGMADLHLGMSKRAFEQVRDARHMTESDAMEFRIALTERVGKGG